MQSVGKFLWLLVPVLLAAENYRIAPEQAAQLSLEVEKTGLLRGKKHLFVYERFQGELSYDAAKPDASSVKMSIESASLVCKDTWVSASDLKKIEKEALENMMAAAKYPRLEFFSSSIKRRADGSFDVAGTLKIRDRQNAVSMVVTMAAQADGSIRFEGSAPVKLTAYGLKPPSAALGAVGTKDEMLFRFAVIARR